MNIAIITARGGSKRIPRKNIREFHGKPIIAYTIEAALTANCFDEVMVSTDDSEIADVAIRYGATVPFLRSQKTSDDFATTADVLFEVIEKYRDLKKYFDYMCCLYPAAPFIKPDNLSVALKKLKENENLDAVLPIVRFSFPVQRALFLKNDKVSFANQESSIARSQDLEPMYHDAGQFYFLKTALFMEKKTLITSNTAGIILPESQVQDIDTIEDWHLAEIKYQLLQRKMHYHENSI